MNTRPDNRLQEIDETGVTTIQSAVHTAVN